MNRLGPLAEREFRLLFAGRVVSMLGNMIAPVGLAFAILELTGSKSDLGLVLAARQLPQVLFLLFGGVFADRLPRHRVMVGSSLVSGASQGVLAALLLSGHAQLWQLFVLSAVNGSSSAFFFPASTGVIPQTVPPALLQQANALLRLGLSGSSIAGPAVAGVVVAASNPGWALAADAITFTAGALFVGRMRLPAGLRMEGSSVVAELREGWREFRSRRWLWAIVVQFAIVNAAYSGTVNVLGPVQAARHLGGAGAYGAIMSATAAGLVAGGLLGLRFRPQRLLLVATLAVFVDVLPLVLFGIPAPTAAIAAGAFASGVGIETFGVLWDTAMQQQIPQEKLSRVSSYDALGSFVLIPAGLAVAGPVADVVGVEATLFGAAALIVVATAPVLLVREVRELRRREAASP
ncbi:MAG TPA: MFS transporter [Gaiellaceae bacterium]|nr:MFS transporter [Gaiellaceae bacterium]